MQYALEAGCNFTSRLVTYRGSQFGSEVFNTLSSICGIRLQYTTAYHLQANGKIERLHRTLKAALIAHGNPAWSETLPTVLLGLRTALQEDTNHTIAQMVYGQNIRLPGEFFQEPKIHTTPETFASQLQEAMRYIRPRTVSRKYVEKIFIPKDLKTTTHIFVRKNKVKKTLEHPYEGPVSVLERTEKYFTLQIKDKQVTVSIDRLKPAYIIREPIDDTTSKDCVQREKPVGSKTVMPESQPELTSKRQSRSGRTIRMPVRFQE